MRIESITARELRMRLKEPFETSFGVTQDRKVVLLEIDTDVGTGWSEVTAMEGPFYNAETIQTAWLMGRDFLSGLVLDVEFFSPEEVSERMENVRDRRWLKRQLSVQCGMLSHGPKARASATPWAEREISLVLVFRLGFSQTLENCSIRWPRNSPADTSGSSSRSSRARTLMWQRSAEKVSRYRPHG